MVCLRRARPACASKRAARNVPRIDVYFGHTGRPVFALAIVALFSIRADDIPLNPQIWLIH